MRMFFPQDLARDYDWNEMVEGWYANLIGELSGEPAFDFFKGARPSHDWAHGLIDPVRIEFKTTSQPEVAIELFKDQNGKVKSGLNATEADLWLTLCHGRGQIPPGGKSGPPIGKLRFTTPKHLRAAVRGREPYAINKSSTITERAYVVNVDMRKVTHWWIGDVPLHQDATGRALYDFDKLILVPNADQVVRDLFEFIRQEKKNVD